MVIGVRKFICTYFLHEPNNCEKCQHTYYECNKQGKWLHTNTFYCYGCRISPLQCISEQHIPGTCPSCGEIFYRCVPWTCYFGSHPATSSVITCLYPACLGGYNLSISQAPYPPHHHYDSSDSEEEADAGSTTPTTTPTESSLVVCTISGCQDSTPYDATSSSAGLHAYCNECYQYKCTGGGHSWHPSCSECNVGYTECTNGVTSICVSGGLHSQ